MEKWEVPRAMKTRGLGTLRPALQETLQRAWGGNKTTSDGVLSLQGERTRIRAATETAGTHCPCVFTCKALFLVFSFTPSMVHHPGLRFTPPYFFIFTLWGNFIEEQLQTAPTGMHCAKVESVHHSGRGKQSYGGTKGSHAAVTHQQPPEHLCGSLALFFLRI